MQLNSRLRLLARADQNYRFAKVDEFLQPAYTPTFSPVILKTQEGLSLETGVEWQHAGSQASAVIYQLDLDNEIAFDPVNFANINLDKTRRRGLMANLGWQAGKRTRLSASYTYTDAEVSSGAFAGKSIPVVAKHSALMGLDYALAPSWQLYGEIYAVSDRVFSGDFDNVLGRLPGFALLNLKAEYTVGDFVFAARVNNVLNKQYAEVGQLGLDPNTFASRPAYFPSPEVNVLLTAAWQFE